MEVEALLEVALEDESLVGASAGRRLQAADIPEAESQTAPVAGALHADLRVIGDCGASGQEQERGERRPDDGWAIEAKS